MPLKGDLGQGEQRPSRQRKKRKEESAAGAAAGNAQKRRQAAPGMADPQVKKKQPRTPFKKTIRISRIGPFHRGKN
jgi:hypothetical protein